LLNFGARKESRREIQMSQLQQNKYKPRTRMKAEVWKTAVPTAMLFAYWGATGSEVGLGPDECNLTDFQKRVSATTV
jgi:hypothetical protein